VDDLDAGHVSQRTSGELCLDMFGMLGPSEVDASFPSNHLILNPYTLFLNKAKVIWL